MSRLLQVGITGGIGAGKSIICKIFRVLGISVYDADSRAKYLMQTDDLLVRQIQESFGEQSYSEGKLNRPYLARQVFNDTQKVNQLNALVHPAVARDYSFWYGQQDPKTGYVVREAALLIESGSYKDLDRLIAVEAPVNLRIARVLKRDPQRSEAQIKSILSKQLTDQDRRRYAQHVIYNDETKLVLPQVLALHKEFLSQQVSG